MVRLSGENGCEVGLGNGTTDQGSVFRALARQGEHPPVKKSGSGAQRIFPLGKICPCQRSAVFSLPVSTLSRISDCTIVAVSFFTVGRPHAGR